MLARTSFWWFGHPLVYFTTRPGLVRPLVACCRASPARLFSDSLAAHGVHPVCCCFRRGRVPPQLPPAEITANWKLAQRLRRTRFCTPPGDGIHVIDVAEIAGRLGRQGACSTGSRRCRGRTAFFCPWPLAMISFNLGGFRRGHQRRYAMNGRWSTTPCGSWVTSTSASAPRSRFVMGHVRGAPGGCSVAIAAASPGADSSRDLWFRA